MIYLVCAVNGEASSIVGGQEVVLQTEDNRASESRMFPSAGATR